MALDRVLVPGDVFVQVCVEVKKLSDLLLAGATAMQREVAHLSEESQVLNALMASHIQLGLIERMLHAIVSDEDEEPPATAGPSGSQPPPTVNGSGGSESHA